jgi:hypothetical protein
MYVAQTDLYQLALSECFFRQFALKVCAYWQTHYYDYRHGLHVRFQAYNLCCLQAGQLVPN